MQDETATSCTSSMANHCLCAFFSDRRVLRTLASCCTQYSVSAQKNCAMVCASKRCRRLTCALYSLRSALIVSTICNQQIARCRLASAGSVCNVHLRELTHPSVQCQVRPRQSFSCGTPYLLLQATAKQRVSIFWLDKLLALLPQVFHRPSRGLH